MKARFPRLDQKDPRDQQPECDAAHRESLTPAIDELQFASQRNLMGNQFFLAGAQVDYLIVSVDGHELSVKRESQYNHDKKGPKHNVGNQVHGLQPP
jgi:hypothetical protein